MRLSDFQATRVVELAVHGIDLADALGVPSWLTPEASDVVEDVLHAHQARARLGWDRPTLIRKLTGRATVSPAELAAAGALRLSFA